VTVLSDDCSSDEVGVYHEWYLLFYCTSHSKLLFCGLKFSVDIFVLLYQLIVSVHQPLEWSRHFYSSGAQRPLHWAGVKCGVRGPGVKVTMCRGWLKPKEIRFQHISELSKADVHMSQFRLQIVPDFRSGNRVRVWVRSVSTFGLVLRQFRRSLMTVRLIQIPESAITHCIFYLL